jgi:AcrR family transcriptional regulator
MPIVSSCSAGVARLLIDRSIYNCHTPKARPRAFDRDFALKSAIQAFSEHGYEGTSTDELLQVMKISRQSRYNAFGDKRRLYIEALKDYIADSVAGQLAARFIAAILSGLEVAARAGAPTEDLQNIADGSERTHVAVRNVRRILRQIKDCLIHNYKIHRPPRIL